MSYFILYLFLTTPLLLSFYYNQDKSIFLLVSGLIALLFIAGALLGLAYKIKSRLSRFILFLPLFLSLFSFELAQLGSFYLQGQSFNSRFFYHFNLHLLQSSIGLYPFLSSLIIGLNLGICMSLYYSLKNKNTLLKQTLPFLMIVLLIGLSLDTAWKNFIYAYRENYQTVAELTIKQLDNLGLNTLAINQTILPATAGKNLVFIYLESLEQIYLNTDIFPNLTPHLNQYRNEGIEATQMQQVLGASWTIAGILSSQCGTPLLQNLFSGGGNDIMQQGFLEQGVCLSDILHQAGYQQTFLGGASTEFAGKGTFLKQHHYDEVLGLEQLLPQLVDPSYRTSWGLYDDSLFDIAVKKYQSLADTGKPFNLTILTLDTHHPIGHPSASCQAYHQNNSILAAVHCTDQLVHQFLQKISKYPAYKNTVVVLFSDHKAMRNDAEPLYPKNNPRHLFFTLLNSGKAQKINQVAHHMDIAPTLLHALEVKHQQHFLMGEDLLKKPNKTKKTGLSSQQISALTYVNSHYFTQKQTQHLCENDYILDASSEISSQIQIGTQLFNLTFDDNKLNKATWQKNLILLSRLSNDGSIQQSLVLKQSNLAYRLQQYPQATYLLISHIDNLSEKFKPKQHSADKPWQVLLFHYGKQATILGQHTELQAIKISAKTCQSQLKQAQQAPNMASHFIYQKECLATMNKTARYQTKTKTLMLDKIQVAGGGLYEVHLQKIDDLHFQVIKLKPLNSTEEKANNSCIVAYYSFNHLNVLDINGQQRTLKLKDVNGEHDIFTIEKTDAQWLQ